MVSIYIVITTYVIFKIENIILCFFEFFYKTLCDVPFIGIGLLLVGLVVGIWILAGCCLALCVFSAANWWLWWGIFFIFSWGFLMR